MRKSSQEGRGKVMRESFHEGEPFDLHEDTVMSGKGKVMRQFEKPHDFPFSLSLGVEFCLFSKADICNLYVMDI